jgi:hypothetical protein
MYQLFETHFDNYVRIYEERFEPNSGPLRPVVARSVEEFLACGRMQGGFARIRCDKCSKEHLLAFSCRTRNFCSSCQAKRSVLFAEKLTGEILAAVPHRHWTFSIPRDNKRSVSCFFSKLIFYIKNWACLGARASSPATATISLTYRLNRCVIALSAINRILIG